MLRRVSRTERNPKRTVAIVGCGRLASSLAPALAEAGYTITEIIVRPQSRPRARVLAKKVGARAVTMQSAALDAALLWLSVPDREICNAAGALAERVATLANSGPPKIRFAFHSSGALTIRELEPLRQLGIASASVHPLMTFVAGAQPSLAGVPFALEGDRPATNLARRIARDLSSESFLLSAQRKPAYHAWATMTSPRFVAYLATVEEAARGAGLTRESARRMSFPILRQTLTNYAALGAAGSFSGPFIRGDVATVAEHLALLSKYPDVREVYLALAEAALDRLPVKNRSQLRRLIKG